MQLVDEQHTPERKNAFNDVIASSYPPELPEGLIGNVENPSKLSNYKYHSPKPKRSNKLKTKDFNQNSIVKNSDNFSTNLYREYDKRARTEKKRK